MNLKLGHVLGVAALGLAAFIAAARQTNNQGVLMAVGVGALACVQTTMHLHIARLRKRLRPKTV